MSVLDLIHAANMRSVPFMLLSTNAEKGQQDELGIHGGHAVINRVGRKKERLDLSAVLASNCTSQSQWPLVPTVENYERDQAGLPTVYASVHTDDGAISTYGQRPPYMVFRFQVLLQQKLAAYANVLLFCVSATCLFSATNEGF